MPAVKKANPVAAGRLEEPRTSQVTLILSGVKEEDERAEAS